MKTALMWSLAVVGFFYGSFKLGPSKEDNNPLGLFMMAVSFGVPLYLTIKNNFKESSLNRAKFEATKLLYEKALRELGEDSDNSEKHQRALDKGREYYSYLHPNTYDMNTRGITSNHQDNSGIVELKVQADINAKTKKGK